MAVPKPLRILNLRIWLRRRRGPFVSRVWMNGYFGDSSEYHWQFQSQSSGPESQIYWHQRKMRTQRYFLG